VKFISFFFDVCGSVHHHLINKPTNVMQLGAIVFVIPWKALYMFRVLFTPIIRSVLKLYMQLLVQSCVGMVSDAGASSKEHPKHVDCFPGNNKDKGYELHHVGCFIN
jgi:hypothetical protein